MTRRRWCLLCSPLLVALFISCDEGQPLAPSANEAMFTANGLAVSTPSSLASMAVSPTQVDLTWQDNSGNESGFEVQRSTTRPDGAYALITTTGADITSYTDAGLSPLTQFCYKVRAFRTKGSKTSYSGFSPVACATTLAPPLPPPPPPPPPPAAPYAADVRPVSSSQVEVTWEHTSTKGDAFRVERSLDGGTSWSIAGTNDWGGRYFVDGDRISEQLVCYRVIAFNAGGESPPSNTDCTTPPAPPTDVTATGIDAETVLLAWKDNSAVEDGYDVLSAYGDFLGSLEPNATSLRLEGSGEWYTFIYVVVARKDGGRSDWSDYAYPTAPAAAAASLLATPFSRTRGEP